MNPFTIAAFVISYVLFGFAHYQSGAKSTKPDPIKRADIERILRTLTADNMMGRPASKPERMEPAAAFLESEFKSIGLEPLPGEKTLRQSFNRQKVLTRSASLIINGRPVPETDVLVVSEKNLFQSANLPVLRIADDTTMKDKRRLFSIRYRALLRDTAAAIVIVDNKLRNPFNAFRNMLKGRIASGQSGTKIFVLGDYEVKNIETRFQQDLQPLPMANIGGMIRGKSKSDEYVIFSAHYDHIGILSAVAGDSIANGADDDASGTTAVVTLARYFKSQARPERSIIFVAFTAEEIGGFGSRHFSEKLDPEKVVAMFNIEMIGKPSKFGKNTAWITGYERSDFGAILQRNLEGTPFKFHPDPYPDQNLFYRSDNATLARLGVPAHSISTDEIDIDKLYHSVDDEFESLSLENMESTIRAIALSSRSIVSGKETPSRIDKAAVQGGR